MFKMNYDWCIYQDTDSVVGSSIINVDGVDVSIEEFYESCYDDFIKHDPFNGNYIKRVSDKSTPSLSALGAIENNPINYVMKHKVSKELFKITNKYGVSVTVTVDHSIIVKDKKSGAISSISPKKLDPKKHFIINMYKDTDTEE